MAEELVLIADDSDFDRRILAAIVKSAGYRVVEAADGLQAWDLYERHRPPLVLLDALMPGIDGFEVARRIKAGEAGAFTSVIFLTSLTKAQELAACVSAGGDDFLSKPYNEVILRAKLEAMNRVQQLHRRLQAQQEELERHNSHLLHEQQTAKAVFDSVATRSYLDVPWIKYLLSPLSIFNGDVLLIAPTPRRTVQILLGDFTGHGLTAAIGAMPLSEAFYGMTQKGFTVRELVVECNRKLYSALPRGHFCCAFVAELDLRRCTIEYWNGGLPIGYLLRHTGDLSAEFVSQHLPLGVLAIEDLDSRTQVIEAQRGDRLIVCTDGIIEAENERGEQFGVSRFEQAIAQGGSGAVVQVQDAVKAHMGTHTRSDDFTMAEVVVVEPEDLGWEDIVDPVDAAQGPEQWSMSYELRDESLRDFNPLPMLVRLVLQTPALRARAGDLHIVLSELYSNALEHGVLRLDSTQKSSAEGFRRYYEQRATRMTNLRGSIRFDFDCRQDSHGGELQVEVIDSGAGFGVGNTNTLSTLAGSATTDEGLQQLHGRGIQLMRSLCDELCYTPPGNRVRASLRWQA